MHKDIHIKSLQLTLEENIKKIKSLQQQLLLIVSILSILLLVVVAMYYFSVPIIFLIGGIGSYIVLKFIQLNRLKVVNKKIEQKLKTLK